MKGFQLFILPIALLFTSQSFAETGLDRTYHVALGELTYTPAKVQDIRYSRKLFKRVDNALINSIQKGHDDYKSAIKASIINGLSHVHNIYCSCGEAAGANIQQKYAGNLLLDGTITLMDVTERSVTSKNNNGIPYEYPAYFSTVSVTLNIKNAADGKLLNSHSFSAQGDKFRTREAAIDYVVKELCDSVTSYYNNEYKISL